MFLEMLRFLRLLLCKRIGKIHILFIVIFLFIAFSTIDLRKKELPLIRDESQILSHIMRRLDKLEKSFQELQSLPKQKRQIIVQQKKMIQKQTETCSIPSNWNYPFCNGKVLWIRNFWQSNKDCYVKTHHINPTDDCSILRYLSEVEAWCPLLPEREKPDLLLSRPKANLRTNKDGLLEMLKPKRYAWIRDRINLFWPYWVEGIEQLKSRTDLTNRPSKNILIFLGSFAHEPHFLDYAYHGGPLGEIVQWTDVIASLYILGHNITLSSDTKDLRLLNIPKNKNCPTKTPDDEFDVIFTDYNGLIFIAIHVGPNHSQYRCKVRVVDSFGTEAEFNFAEYKGTIKGGRSPWANADLNLRQIMTMFPHSPDNTFLGFVVDNPPKSTPIQKQQQSGKPIGLVYGKDARFWQGKTEYLDVLKEYFEIHATLGAYGAADIKNVPNYVVKHGILKRKELIDLLNKAKVFIGMGFPYEGPAPLEAIAHGCIFINAKLDPPQNRLNAPFFKNKPTFRELTSQHPYAEDFIGEPYVFTIDISNKTIVRQTAEKIVNTEVKPYLPLEWTPEGMLERLNVLVEKMDFCGKDTKVWPPLSELKLYKGKLGASCKDTCIDNGLLCESLHFVSINTLDSFKTLDIPCKKITKAIVLDAPSYTPDKSCLLQEHPLAFSCVARQPNKFRLCPCRDFQSQQVALCKNCS